jgi:hypothetical protein
MDDYYDLLFEPLQVPSEPFERTTHELAPRVAKRVYFVRVPSGLVCDIRRWTSSLTFEMLL